jgi:hypothetical protein
MNQQPSPLKCAILEIEKQLGISRLAASSVYWRTAQFLQEIEPSKKFTPAEIACAAVTLIEG